MKLKELKLPLIFLAFASALMGGCFTPKSVVELETKTSLNTAALSSQLQAFAANHQKIVSAREQTYADEMSAAAVLQAKLDSLVAIQRIAGNTDVVKLYQDILNESDLEQRNYETNANLLAETLAQMAQGIAAVKAPAKQLDSIAKSLADLVSQDTVQNQAKELSLFYSDVAGQVAKQQIARNAALKSALTNSPSSSVVSAASITFKNILN
jgi:hypothetical protein